MTESIDFMTDEPTRPTQYTSERVDRERRFHDALILSGKASIATKEWWETPGGRVRFSRRISLLKKHLPTVTAPSRHRILVIGCGDGEWVNTISEFADVVGIDISPEIVANTNRHLRNPAAEVEVGDAHRLNYADGTFDVCFANSTLHHLDLHVALPEIRRVLRPGGRLIAGEPNRTNPLVWRMYRNSENRRRYGLTPDEEAFTRRSIRKLLQQNFDSVSVTCFDFWHPLFGQTDQESFVFRLLLAIERIPLVSEMSGSLWISAQR